MKRIHLAYTVELPSAFGGYAQPHRKVIEKEWPINASWLDDFEREEALRIMKHRGINSRGSWCKVVVQSWQTLGEW